MAKIQEINPTDFSQMAQYRRINVLLSFLYKLNLYVRFSSTLESQPDPSVITNSWSDLTQPNSRVDRSLLHSLLHIIEPNLTHGSTDLYYTLSPSYNRTKVLRRLINIIPRQNSFLWSSVHFHSTCFHLAQVCWSFILQLISPLMELSTYKSKILHS